MKAIVRETYGSPDVLRLGNVPTPTEGDDGVLVRVYAASANAGPVTANVVAVASAPQTKLLMLRRMWFPRSVVDEIRRIRACDIPPRQDY